MWGLNTSRVLYWTDTPNLAWCANLDQGRVAPAVLCMLEVSVVNGILGAFPICQYSESTSSIEQCSTVKMTIYHQKLPDLKCAR